MGGTSGDLVLTDPGYLSAPSTSVPYYATHRVQPALVGVGSLLYRPYPVKLDSGLR